MHLVDKLRDRVRDKGLKTGEQATDALRDIIAEDDPGSRDGAGRQARRHSGHRRQRRGKTTSIAKLADYYTTRQGKRVR